MKALKWFFLWLAMFSATYTLITACGRTRVTHSFTIDPLVVCVCILASALFIIRWFIKNK